MVHVAVKKSAYGRLDDARFALVEFASMPITRWPVDTALQWQTAMDHELSGYDAAYLQLALNLGAPLATFGQRLGEAARRAFAR